MGFVTILLFLTYFEKILNHLKKILKSPRALSPCFVSKYLLIDKNLGSIILTYGCRKDFFRFGENAMANVGGRPPAGRKIHIATKLTK